MQHSLSKGRVELTDASLTIDKIVNERGSHVPRESDHLRFLFSPSPLMLYVGDMQQFVTERSAIKVQPDTPIGIEAANGAVIYQISFTQDEQRYLDELKKDPFFYKLSGKERKEWDNVKDKDLDFRAWGEWNATDIVYLPRVVIAPPHSRGHRMVGNGWQLMYAKASRAVGVGSDYIFKVRDQESLHAHKLITEVYICLGGEMALQVDQDEVMLKQDDVAALPPGPIHCMKRLVKTPYQGITLQTPSIPGDKIVHL